MFSICIIWSFIGLTTALIGFGVLKLMRAFLSCEKQTFRCDQNTDHVLQNVDGLEPGTDLQSIIMTGLTTVTVYAQVWSLFGEVGATAVTILFVLSMAVLVACRQEIMAQVAKWKILHPVQDRQMLILLLFVILIFSTALFTARGYMHYDSDLYHAQSIRWMEEYGIVKGLANLHCRLGYNSSAFAVSALYSFSFLGGQSYHTVQGFFVLMMAIEAFKPVREIIQKTWKPSASDAVRLAAIYYYFAVSDELVGPASDYFLVAVSFYLIIRFLDAIKENDVEHLCLLSLLAVYAVTIKLSAACLILLAVYPAALLFKKHEWTKIAKLLLLGIGIMAPFLIRNIIITGYLVYPFPSLDLFDVPWKVPLAVTQSDALEIKVWGRGMTDVRLADAPISDWFLPWFSGQTAVDRLALLGCVVSLGGLLIKGRDRFVQIVLTISVVFWFVSAPLFRYGCVFVYACASLGFARYLEAAGRAAFVQIGADQNNGRKMEKAVLTAFAALILLFVSYKSLATIREQIRYGSAYAVLQQDYGTYETYEYEIDGLTFYAPVSGDRCGYEPFPSANIERTGFMKPVSSDLKDGFVPDK